MEKVVIQIKKVEDTIKVQAQLLSLLTELERGKTFDCTIKPYRKKRSIDANAYFHVLVDKIAKATNKGNDETKIYLNLEYGTPAMIDDKLKFAVQVPKGADISKMYIYSKWYKEIEDNGVLKDCYMLYKHTHELDSKEMAFLIDRTVEEAQALGIETKTPNEIAEMKSLWKKGGENADLG